MSKKRQPVAFLWTLDNTEGIPENKPAQALDFDGKRSPFGTPGKDHSRSFKVTCEPLYASPSGSGG